MACTPVALSSSTTCETSIGGMLYAYYCKWSEITSFTVTTKAISAIVMNTTGSWKKWAPTRDSTAFFNSTGVDASKSSFQYDQECFMKFAGISLAAVKAANDMTQCCDLVGIIFMNDGSVILQGVELNSALTGVIQSKEAARFVPSVLSGAGDEESKVEFRVKSKAKSIAIADNSAITSTYVEAL